MHPFQHDFVTGERFALMADVCWGPGGALPSPGIVYVKTDDAGPFMDALRAAPKAGPYSVILHNSDRTVDAELAARTPANVTRVYGANCTAADVDGRFLRLPIGLPNTHSVCGDVPLLVGGHEGKSNRQHDFLLACTVHARSRTPEREALYRWFGSGGDGVLSYPVEGPGSPRYRDYVRDLWASLYVFSPPGAGLDCHRTWEAIVCGAVPVVKRTGALDPDWLRGMAAVDDYTADLHRYYITPDMQAARDALSWRAWLSRIAPDAQPRRIISFAVFGSDGRYNRGLIENLALAKIHYPGWRVRLYWGTGATCVRRAAAEGAETIFMQRSDGLSGTFWRFLAASAPTPDVDAVIFRDADSRIGAREAAAVKAWIDSGKPLHVMHDHRHHSRRPVLAGMWGVRPGLFPSMAAAIKAFPHRDKLGEDERFLAKEVLAKFSPDEILRHSSVETPWPSVPFPEHAFDPHHVGAIVETTPAPVEVSPQADETREQCVPCRGAGKIMGAVCAQCGGRGYLPVLNPRQGEPPSVQEMRSAEQAFLFAAVRNAASHTYLDIGANDGLLGSTTVRMAQKGWQGMAVEPEPTAFLAMVTNYEALPTVMLVHAAVCPRPHPSGLTQLWAHTNHRLSTTEHARRVGSPLADGYPARPYLVGAVTVLQLHQRMPRWTFVSIDVEGGNLALLASFDWRESQTLAILVEHQGEARDGFDSWARDNAWREAWCSRENVLFVREGD